MRRASCSSAFTLLELLAVVLVLGLLSITLLPGVARTKFPSARTKCLDNLRQLTQAAGMFALDNHDALPYPNWGNTSVGWLYKPSVASPPRVSDSAYREGLLWQFTKTVDFYLCPLDFTSKFYIQRQNQFSTYVMNGAVCGYGTQTTGFRLNQFKGEAYCMWEPDETLNGIGAFAYNDASAYPDRNEGPGRNHPGGTPVGTFDGAALFPSVKSFGIQQTARGPNLVWCSPTPDGH
jgi:type II secretory pathway pseudopilin PulG